MSLQRITRTFARTLAVSSLISPSIISQKENTNVNHTFLSPKNVSLCKQRHQLRHVSGTSSQCQLQTRLQDHQHYEPSAPPLTQLNEEENAFKETVQKMAKDRIEPLVSQMDDTSNLEQSVIDALFENGVSEILESAFR